MKTRRASERRKSTKLTDYIEEARPGESANDDDVNAQPLPQQIVRTVKASRAKKGVPKDDQAAKSLDAEASGREQHARKRQKMAAERADEAADTQEPDSEDEAPEELSSKAAKAQANALNSQIKSQQNLARKKSRKGKEDGAKTMKPHKSDEGADKTTADRDILPAAVIEALQKQKREELSLQRDSPKNQEEAETMLEGEDDDPDNMNVQEREVGNVRVAILSPNLKFAPSVAAKEYASQRLYGSRHRRSQDMLRTVQGKSRRQPWDNASRAGRLKA